MCGFIRYMHTCLHPFFKHECTCVNHISLIVDLTSVNLISGHLRSTDSFPLPGVAITTLSTAPHTQALLTQAVRLVTPLLHLAVLSLRHNGKGTNRQNDETRL